MIIFYLELTVPSNVKAIPMTYSSVLLQWDSNSIDEVGFKYYAVNIKPPAFSGNCTKGVCYISSTKVYLVNMKPLVTYVFTVSAANCVGYGPESVNVTFNITAYSK